MFESLEGGSFPDDDVIAQDVSRSVGDQKRNTRLKTKQRLRDRLNSLVQGC